MNSITRFEEKLKHAAAGGQYASIENLALQYGDAAREEIGKLPTGDPRIADMAQRVLAVLEWARLVVTAGRAQTADELRNIPFLNRYVGATAERPPMVRLDA